MRRGTERGKATEVHSNRRHVKKKKKARDPGESVRQQQDFQATSPPGCSGTHAAVGLWVNGTSRKISPSAFCCSSGESSGARTSQSCNIQSRESWGWGWGCGGVQCKFQIFLYISLAEKIHLNPYTLHILVAERSSGTCL